MSHPVGQCFRHSQNPSEPHDPHFKAHRYPVRDYVFVWKDVPNAETMLDGLDIPDQPTQYAVVRGKEFAWLCDDPTAQRLIVYITREEIAKGEEVETFSVDSFDEAMEYLATGMAYFPTPDDFFAALQKMEREEM